MPWTTRAPGDAGVGTIVHASPSQWNGPAGPPTQTSFGALAQIADSALVGDGTADQTPRAKRTIVPLAPINHRSSGPTANACTKRSLVGNGCVQHQPSDVQTSGRSGTTAASLLPESAARRPTSRRPQLDPALARHN